MPSGPGVKGRSGSDQKSSLNCLTCFPIPDVAEQGDTDHHGGGMKVVLLTALGCIFWLFPLAAAVSLFWRFGVYEDGFGFNYDSLWLLGLPICMIAATLLLGYRAKRRPLPGVVIVGSSALAFVAAFCWLGVWGQGV